MVVVTVKMFLALVLVASMMIDLGAVGDTDTVRTISPPPLPSLPLFPGSRGSRPGLCPQIRRFPVDRIEAEDDGEDKVALPSLCGNLCTKDDACPLGKKCCPTTCGYACYDSVILVDV